MTAPLTAILAMAQHISGDALSMQTDAAVRTEAALAWLRKACIEAHRDAGDTDAADLIQALHDGMRHARDAGWGKDRDTQLDDSAAELMAAAEAIADGFRANIREN